MAWQRKVQAIIKCCFQFFSWACNDRSNKRRWQRNLPDEENIINNKFDLEWYLDEIYASKEEFDAAKFTPNDPVFNEQENYLNSFVKEDFQKLFRLFDNFKEHGYGDKFISSETFQELHKILYDLKLIFDFKWMAWQEGWKNINDTNFDYSGCSLLDISMYLTAIFRADRFSDGTIEHNFRNGTLDKIFNSLRPWFESPRTILSKVKNSGSHKHDPGKRN